MEKIKDVIAYLEAIAPPVYQESYDNSGLIVGDREKHVQKVLVALDCTESVVDEAINEGCNLIVAHHPIVFSGLKSLTGASYIERTVIKAIKHDVAIYAIHTNLDNVQHGVNAKIAERLKLQNKRILSPKKNLLRKLAVFVPEAHAEQVRGGLFTAGAGAIGDYDECSFNLKGTGTFKASDIANPYVGEKGERHKEEEVRVEVIYPAALEGQIIREMINSHPYEEVAYDIFPLVNSAKEVGSGMIGELKEAMEEKEFLAFLKKQMKTACIRHTKLLGKEIKSVAVCGGSGSFLLPNAKRAGADIFITGDFKYHQFFDAEKDLVIADIGHYESEQFTVELIGDILTKKFSTFAVRLTRVNTNPINYLT